MQENRPGNIDIDALLKAGRLEAAQDYYDQTKTARDRQKINHQLAALKFSAKAAQATGEIRKADRLKRREMALEIFKSHGLNPDKLIRPTDLTAGYFGKILLVIISGRRIGKRICLRSGDDWHHEILRRTEEEIRDLGFEDSLVTPVGGAAIRSDQNDRIVIFGSSDDYGTCDKKIAADLIAAAFPKKRVHCCR
ncbi:MAG: hypothetical protein DSY90_08740 [Deltaproteobacteria bacterium]|nr:MAG: hypothetical protein DSY90_08740 [Deltaproteobacteria bacterium]